MASEYVRVHRRQLQTPVRCYEHPGTGRKMTVTGTYHLGTPPYHDGLREVIDKLEANGALVQCENSRRAVISADADEQEQETRRQLDRAGEPNTGQDVVLVWGQAHLPGLHAGLTAVGFERTGTLQWHTVVRRRPSIIGALLRMLVRWPAPQVRQVPA